LLVDVVFHNFAENGYDLVRRLRAAGCSAVVIIVTGAATSHVDIDEALECGANFHTVKCSMTVNALIHEALVLLRSRQRRLGEADAGRTTVPQRSGFQQDVDDSARSAEPSQAELRLDSGTNLLYFQDSAVELTRVEAKLFCYLHSKRRYVPATELATGVLCRNDATAGKSARAM
jgi:DNA-binding response OmpR family regulator